MGNKAYPKIETAFKIAARYPDRVPQARELMDEFGFSRTMAFKFTHAMRSVRAQDGGAVINNVLSGAV